jgi:hypothetical protein
VSRVGLITHTALFHIADGSGLRRLLIDLFAEDVAVTRVPG